MSKNVKDFAQFENTEGLFYRKYKGVPYWQAIRFYVCQLMNDDNRSQTLNCEKTSRKAADICKIVIRAVFLSVSSLLHSRIPKKFDVLLTSALMNSKDPVLFQCWDLPNGISSYFVNGAFNPLQIKMGDTRTNLMGLYIKVQSTYYLKKITHSLPKDSSESNYLKELVQKLNNSFQMSICETEIEQMIQYWYIEYIVTKQHFEAFLKKTTFKMIVLECYYQESLYALYEIAKQRGITIVELQHGIICNHQEYWFEDISGINNIVPDYFLIFGKKHLEWIRLPLSEKVIVTGFPYQNAQIQLVEDIKTDEKRIIIYPVCDERFENEMDSFADRISEHGFKVFLKIHPAEVLDVLALYPILTKNRNITVITDQTKSVYYWLKSAKHHVLSETTVGQEAMTIPNINVYVATFVQHMQSQLLLDANIARGFSTGEELEELIKSPYQANNIALGNLLYAPNATQNMENFFEYLCKNETRH